MRNTFTRRQSLAFLGSLACLSSAAQAAWPSKPLRFVVPYPAGGTPDTFTREVAAEVARQLGVAAVVENKPGASGLLGMRAVSQAVADAHTFAFVSSGQVTLTATNPKFNLLEELRPVIRLTASPFVVVVNADSPVKSMAELIARVQANPGRLTFGSAGTGSPSHMAVEYLHESTGNFKALHVPFKGAVESFNAIMGGQIDFTIAVLGAALPHIQAGKLRALGVTTARRVALLPQVPTIAEGNGGNYDYQSWGGFMAQASTPEAVITRAAQAFGAAMRADAVVKYLGRTGSFADVSESSAAFAAQLARDIATERHIAKRLGITLE